MIVIKESTDMERVGALAKRYDIDIASMYGRYLIMEEEGHDIGLAVMSVRGAKIIIRNLAIDNDKSFAYWDLLARSTLNFLVDFAPIFVRVEETRDYWRPFGFVEADGGMEVMNTDIVFVGSLCGEKHTAK